MQAVMSQGELRIASFHTRTGALKELSAFPGRSFQALPLRGSEFRQGSLTLIERAEQDLRLLLEMLASGGLGFFGGGLL